MENSQAFLLERLEITNFLGLILIFRPAIAAAGDTFAAYRAAGTAAISAKINVMSTLANRKTTAKAIIYRRESVCSNRQQNAGGRG